MNYYEIYSEQIKALYNRKLSLSVHKELMEMTFKYSEKNKIEDEIKNKHLLELESKNKYIIKCSNCIDGKIPQKEDTDNAFGIMPRIELIKCKRCYGSGKIAILEEELPRYTTFIKGKF